MTAASESRLFIVELDSGRAKQLHSEMVRQVYSSQHQIGLVKRYEWIATFESTVLVVPCSGHNRPARSVNGRIQLRHSRDFNSLLRMMFPEPQLEM